MGVEAILYIVILIFSVIIHEVSHGYAAQMLGDPTARLSGRLTLNPIPHIDPFGSIILPGILLLTGSGVLVGWAKPVPYNPYNLSNQKWGTFFVAISGVLANFLLAIIFGLLIRFSYVLGLSASLIDAFSVIVILNLALGIFNLLPVPPLDGSKVLSSLLPYRWMHIQQQLEQYWFITIFIAIFAGLSILGPLVGFFFSLITGISFF